MSHEKLKALESGLRQYDGIDSAKAFPDDFTREACADGLMVYDRNFDVVYRSGEDSSSGVSSPRCQIHRR